MKLLEKITDTLLSKNWILTLISFVVSVVISVFIPMTLFDKLPFDAKINVIVGFVAIAIAVFLVLYLIVWLFNRGVSKAKLQERYSKLKSEETEENIEKWREFFDQLSDEEYSILMFFVITENKRPYKRWGQYFHSYNSKSIFSEELEGHIFYKTTSSEKAPVEEAVLNDGTKVMASTMGDATIYTLKDSFYNLLKAIIELKGSLSHHPRKTYKLPNGNGADLEEFQNSKY